MLQKDEVVHELKIRGLPCAGLLQDLRKKLVKAVKDNEGPQPHILSSLSVESEITTCSRKIQALEWELKELGDTTGPNDVKRIDSRLLHLYRRISAISGGSEDQKETVKHLLEGIVFIRSELDSVKAGGDSTPGLSSPVPVAPLDDEAIQERRDQYKLQPTPPLNNFKIDPKLSDKQFTVKTQDVANQFAESNFYLQQLHRDQRAMMLNGVYLTEPQATAVHELMEKSISKVATAVERSFQEVASLRGEMAELVGAVKQLTQCQNSMGVNLNAVVSSTSHLADRLTQVETGTCQQIAALGEQVKGLTDTVHGWREHREPNPQPNVLPSMNQSPLIQPATNQLPLPNNNVGWPPCAQQAHSQIFTQCHPNLSSQPAPRRESHFPPPPRDLLTSPNNAHEMPNRPLYSPTSDPVPHLMKAVNNIAWYRGTPTSGSAEKWVAQIKNLKRFRERSGEFLSEELWVQAAISRAQDEPALYLQRHQHEIQTLDQLEGVLRRRFEGIRTELSYIQDLERARMGPDETITQYGERVKSIAERADPTKNPDTNNIALQAFIRGLPPNIAMSTATNTPHSVSDAMAKAQAAASMCEAIGVGVHGPRVDMAMVAAVNNMPSSRPSSPSQGGEGKYNRGWSTRSQRAESTSPPRRQPRSPNSGPPRWKPRFKCSLCRLNNHFGWECEYRMGGPKHGQIPPSRTDILAEIASRNTPDGRMGDVNQ